MDSAQPNTHWWAPRVLLVLVALFLGDFLFVRARSAWTNYWVLRDGVRGMAVIQDESWLRHKTVFYRYTADQRQYEGTSPRNWQEATYRRAGVGDETPVYFSASHPWLSLLNKPGSVVVGLPVVLIALVIELWVVFTLLRPRSRWAMSLSGEDRDVADGKAND